MIFYENIVYVVFYFIFLKEEKLYAIFFFFLKSSTLLLKAFEDLRGRHFTQSSLVPMS